MRLGPNVTVADLVPGTSIWVTPDTYGRWKPALYLDSRSAVLTVTRVDVEGRLHQAYGTIDGQAEIDGCPVYILKAGTVCVRTAV